VHLLVSELYIYIKMHGATIKIEELHIRSRLHVKNILTHSLEVCSCKRIDILTHVITAISSQILLWCGLLCQMEYSRSTKLTDMVTEMSKCHV